MYYTQTSASFTGTARDNLYYEPTGFTSGPFTSWTFTNNKSISSSANIYNGPSGYSGTQGANQWSYQYYNGSSYVNLSYDSSSTIWGSSKNNVSQFDQMPSSTQATGLYGHGQPLRQAQSVYEVEF